MNDEELEAEVLRTLRAKANMLTLDDRTFDPGIGSVVDLEERRRRGSRTLWTALLAAVVVVAVIAVALAVRSPGSKPPKVGDTTSTIPVTTTTLGMVTQSQPAPEALVQQVTSVPPDVVPGPIASKTVNSLRALPGPAAPTAEGKVRIVWVGAEYCPYCAAERWPLIMALSRFGAFSNLSVTGSAITTPVGSPEVWPNTQTFSFHGSSYASKYIDFEAVESEDNRYKALDQMTAAQSELLQKYDAPPYVDSSSQGAIPFVYIDNAWLISGASYDVGVLKDKNVQQIADSLRDPTSEIAKSVDPVANVITARLCAILGRAAPVCGGHTIDATGLAGVTGFTG